MQACQHLFCFDEKKVKANTMTRICTSAALLLLLACAASATIVKPNLPLSATGPKAEIHDFFKPSHTTFKPVKTSPEEPEEPLITPPEEPVDTPEPVHLEPEHGASISLSELPEHSVIHPERPVTDPVGSTGKDVSLLKKFEKNREALFAKIGEHKDSISLPEVFEHSVIDPKRPVTEPVDSTGKEILWIPLERT